MKKIIVSDVSFLKNYSAENSLTFKEKLDASKLLLSSGVDVLEFPYPTSESDGVLIKTVSASVKKGAIGLVCSTEKEIEGASDLLKSAKNKRIIVSIPSSPVQMEYVTAKRPKAVLESIPVLVKKALEICPEVEISFLDATRADASFLNQSVESAVVSGAKYITLSDLSGEMTSEKYSEFIKSVIDAVPSVKDVAITVACSNAFSFGIANTFSALSLGASGIKVSAFTSVLTSFYKTAVALESVGVKEGYQTNLDYTLLKRTLNSVKDYGEKKKATVVSENNQDIKSGLTIDELSKIVKARGYELNKEDLKKVFEDVKRLSEKKTINTVDLDAVIASISMEVPETYKIESFSVNSSNVLTATANIVLIKDGKRLSGLSYGNGAIDASFLAIENITNEHFEVEDFSIGAVTEGKEAIGQAIVKLRYNGKIYSGRGVSTDIVGASIRAYINAINKICYER